MRTLMLLAVLGFSCLVSSVSAQSPASTSPVVADILKLSRAKVDEGVVLAYLKNAPRGNVSAADVLTLHSNGISSRVLVALLDPHPTADRGQMEAPAEVLPPVSEPAAQNAEASAPGTSPTPSVAVVETPVVDYVSAPVYVGVGSIYYGAAWCASGWGWGWGWGWGYPWYGYGCYPYYYGRYAHYGYHHHHHGHGGHHGHHHGGGLHLSGGRSTIAASGGNQNSGLAASAASRSVSASATTRPQVAGNRAETSTTARNFSSRTAGNASAGVARVATSPGGNMVPRSSTYTANARTTAAGVGQNGGARPTHPTVTPSGGANRPVTVPGTGQQSSTMAGRSAASPTRSAPSSFRPGATVTPRYAVSPRAHSGYQGGGQTATGPGFSGGHSSVRSFSAPASVGNYSAGRSYGGGSFRGGYSGGVSRGFSGGGGGSRGGGFGGGGHGGGGGGGRR